MKPLTLAKYNYDSFPEEWKIENDNPYKGVVFMYLGEISNMPGHGYVQNINTGAVFILDIENLVELTEDEL